MSMSKPNLLLIMCDQLRADVLGCYGNQLVRTPNIDRLAETGICFDQAYSQTPVCIPARHGLISGQNPFEIGLTDNNLDIEEIKSPMPEMIRRQGYFTEAIGKMHFNPQRRHYGFDRMFLSEELPQHIFDDDYLMFLREKGFGHITEPQGKRSEQYYVPQISELPEELHATAWTADKTCEALRRNRNRPFFLFGSFIKPHPPFDPSEPYDKLYNLNDIPDPIRSFKEKDALDYTIHVQNDYKVNGIDNVTDKDLRRIRAYYYGSISQIDIQIGKILDALDVYGLRDNTLILFTADHGEMLGDHYSFGKRTFYEASAKVPMIMSWPGALPQSERRDSFVMLQDIYATLLKVSGSEIPDISSGRNMIEVVEKPQSPWRNKIFAEFGHGRALKMMLRWEHYKYIYHTNGGLEQLFDLEQDPHELNNIAEENSKQCQKCKEEMKKYYRLYNFEDVFDKQGNLKKYTFQTYQPCGFLDQHPEWPNTVID